MPLPCLSLQLLVHRPDFFMCPGDSGRRWGTGASWGGLGGKGGGGCGVGGKEETTGAGGQGLCLPSAVVLKGKLAPLGMGKALLLFLQG